MTSCTSTARLRRVSVCRFSHHGRSVVTLNGLHLVRRLTGVDAGRPRSICGRSSRAADRTICVSTPSTAICARSWRPAAARAVVVHNGVAHPGQLDASERSEVREELGLDKSDTSRSGSARSTSERIRSAAVRAARESAVASARRRRRAAPARGRTAARRRASAFSGTARRDALTCWRADIFVQTSHREGFAFSLLEAMAARAPAGRDRSPRERRGGRRLRNQSAPGRSRGLTSTLGRLAANERRAVELGQRASRRVARLFSATEMARRTRAVYDEVLAGYFSAEQTQLTGRPTGVEGSAGVRSLGRHHPAALLPRHAASRPPATDPRSERNCVTRKKHVSESRRAPR